MKKTHLFRRAATIYLSLALLLAVIAIAAPLANNGTLSVTVLDNATNNPIKNATVEVIETKQKATTDDKGIVTLSVTVGQTGSSSFTIRADHPSYLKKEMKNIIINANQTTSLTFKLDAGLDGDKKDEFSDYSGSTSKIRKNGEFEAGVLAPAQVGGGSVSALHMKSSGFAAFPADEFNTAEYSKIVENEFKSVHENPLSTFSIDVDGASYSNVRHFITQGSVPPKDAVRIEEMINYFKYEYPQPRGEHPFSITTEMAACPWAKDHKIALIGLQGKEIPKEELPPSNLVFLLDVSGSMMPPERLPLIKRAFKLLTNELRPEDHVAIVVYAGNAGLVLPSTPGSDKKTILDALDKLEAGGSTAGGAGIQLAYKVAQDNFLPKGNNRVILATDGDFNIGISSTGDLTRLIEDKRSTGIYLTTIGVGTDNYKDTRMEALADKGNGNYYYIDNLLEAQKVFVKQMGGTLNTIAKDVKIQIEFNPAKVKGYRLIGYENRLLAKEDFNNDKKDAGELGSGHTVTAMYEIIPAGVPEAHLDSVDALKYQTTNLSNAAQSEEMMTVKFRYKPPTDTVSKLITQPVKESDITLAEASNNLRWATAVSEFGMILTDSKFKGTASVDKALSHARSAKGNDEEGYRAEFIKLIDMYKLLNKATRIDEE